MFPATRGNKTQCKCDFSGLFYTHLLMCNLGKASHVAARRCNRWKRKSSPLDSKLTLRRCVNRAREESAATFLQFDSIWLDTMESSSAIKLFVKISTILFLWIIMWDLNITLFYRAFVYNCRKYPSF